MPKYIAFLRAINVGGHVVKMDRLRGLFEELEFSNVETFINSGNVIFDSPSKATGPMEKKIGFHLQEKLGYPVETFIRSTSELAAIADYKPFDASDFKADGGALYIGFLASAPSTQAKNILLSIGTPLDEFHIWERHVYWLCKARLTDSKVSGALIEKTLGMKATFRNTNTVHRLVAKYR